MSSPGMGPVRAVVGALGNRCSSYRQVKRGPTGPQRGWASGPGNGHQPGPVWLLGHHSPPLTAPPRPRLPQPHTPRARLGDGGVQAPSLLTPIHPLGNPSRSGQVSLSSLDPSCRAVREGVQLACQGEVLALAPHPPLLWPLGQCWPQRSPPLQNSSPGPSVLGQALHLRSTLHRPGTGLAALNPDPRLALACSWLFP